MYPEKTMKIFLLLIIALTFSCKSKQEEAPKAEEPAPLVEVGDSAEEAHEVEIGDLMYAISRRYANIWYAGEAGNAALVKYQTHEIEEIIEELEESGVREGKILVGAELTKTIVPHLEAMETAVEAGNMDNFRAAYDKAITSCNSCHVQTGHPYLVVIRPAQDPYSNLNVTP